VQSIKTPFIELSSEEDVDDSGPSIINSDQEFSISPTGYEEVLANNRR